MRSCSPRPERGAALVEFALIVPVLFMLILGMVTGAIAYNRNLAISHAGQQTARYAATLPLSSYPSVDAWLDAVAARVDATSEGALAPGVDGRNVCVAFVHPAKGTTRSRTVGRFDSTVTRVAKACFVDGLPDNEARAQVALMRTGRINLVLFGTVGLELSKAVTAHYEGTT